MATATPRIVEIEKTVIEERVDGVTLELSTAEAEVLMAITAKIGGDPHKSDRGHVDNIGNALREAGVKDWGQTDAYKRLSGTGLSFDNKEEFAW